MDDLTDGSFARYLSSHERVVVDAWAPWCIPCRKLEPILEELAHDYGPSVAFARLNTDTETSTAQALGIMGMPTLVLFERGQRVDQVVGLMPKGALQQRLQKAFGL